MIRRVLVANRGEIALRISYTLREMGVQTLAVFTEPDKYSLHLRTSDDALEISSYLDAKEIVRVATENGADAVHPGYGFLSENPSLAEECAAAGIIFIGPQAGTIRTMGDKLESKRVMQKAGVPVVPTLEWRSPSQRISAAGQSGRRWRRERNAARRNSCGIEGRDALRFAGGGCRFRRQPGLCRKIHPATASH